MKKWSAFTLIETIIAISIFCIGILTVLFGVSKTLRNQNYANTQIKSAFFAREGIELMFNLRDANYHKELPWNCIFQGNNSLTESGCINNLTPGTVLKISIGSGDKYLNIDDVKPYEQFDLEDEKKFDEIFEDYKIYRHDGNEDMPFIYDHSSENGEDTGFARYIVVSEVTGISKDNLLKIESHVLYKRGELKGDKVMETFIGNYEF